MGQDLDGQRATNSTPGHVNPWYPTNGRDTLYPPYERFAPTGTIGEFFAARERGEAADPACRHCRRTTTTTSRSARPGPTTSCAGYGIFEPDTPLDAKGNPPSGETLDAEPRPQNPGRVAAAMASVRDLKRAAKRNTSPTATKARACSAAHVLGPQAGKGRRR
jgi:hypothetical protein